MKNNLLCAVLVLLTTLSTQAQEIAEEPAGSTEATVETPAEVSSGEFTKAWVLSASNLIWNEKLEFRQGLGFYNDVANFSLISLMIKREYNSVNWGVHIGAMAGVGKANGGGNTSNVDYAETNIPVTIVGFTPRLYYNLSDRINLGLSSFNFLKSISWPEKTGIQVNSGRSFNSALALDIHVRLFERWEFNQGLGVVAEGATLWNVGFNYRY